MSTVPTVPTVPYHLFTCKGRETDTGKVVGNSGNSSRRVVVSVLMNNELREAELFPNDGNSSGNNQHEH
jgi:hypothetical protein